MALDPYSPCPCGSGKKFKWCCQPVHVEISRAFELDAEGQYDAALRVMDEVAAQHPGNPEVWGRKAQLLYQMDKVDESEAALQKAFDLSPNYPFGHFLRGRFRHFEGEIPGALIMFRKAADLYDPEAKSVLGQLYGLIADCESKLHRPVAARAALQMALRFDPNMEELRKALEQMSGPGSGQPPAARRDYTFMGLPPGAAADRRAAWDRALQAGPHGSRAGKLADAARAFELLVKEYSDDAPAWYNLALVRAWQGDNPAALEALDRYVSLESDEARAAEAWTLAEVLRCGQGMEDHADYLEYSAIIPLRDPKAFLDVLTELERERRLVGVQVRQEEGVLTGVILEKFQALTPELADRANPRLGAYLLLAGNIVRLWHTCREAWDKVIQELRGRAAAVMGEPQTLRAPAPFFEVPSEGLAFPLRSSGEAESKERMSAGFARFVEETWLHRPLQSLNLIPPIDAAWHDTLRKKLRGVVQFLQECTELAGIPYDFERLRRKLGLTTLSPETGERGGVKGAGPQDIPALGAAELAGLDPASLSDDQLETAYHTALKLDARDLTGCFARSLVSRPPRPERPDRSPFYGQLVQLALADGDTQAALDLLKEGEKSDGEHNQGRRRDDYQLRLGQVHARRGDIDQAQELFDAIIARTPAELRFRSTAAESMLSARQGPRALRFAQEGLDLARKQNNRDSEEHFLELLAAAQK